MIFRKTNLDGVYIVEIEKAEDERGFFARLHCQKEFKDKTGIDFHPVQFSISYNAKKGTLRGLHFQVAPKEEAKLVICVRGAIFDVVVDIRRDSPTFGKWSAFFLSPENYKEKEWFSELYERYKDEDKVFFPSPRSEVFIPRGFAHGFITLEDDTEILYMIDEFYSPEHSRGIRWDSPEIKIQWPIVPKVVSQRDKNFPTLSKFFSLK